MRRPLSEIASQQAPIKFLSVLVLFFVETYSMFSIFHQAIIVVCSFSVIFQSFTDLRAIFLTLYAIFRPFQCKRSQKC